MKKKPNPKVVRAAILEVVDNQLRDGTPPETKETLQRLIREGYSAEDAKGLIGTVVATEIFGVLKYGAPFDQARFVAALKQLPKLLYD
jgi:hypothetical protein